MWQSADPVLGDYLNGERNNGVYTSLNLGLYSYGLLNPLRVIDPDGRSGEDVLNVLEDYSSQTLEPGDAHPPIATGPVPFSKDAPIMQMGEAFGALAAVIVGGVTGDDRLAEEGFQGLAEQQQTNKELLGTLLSMGRGGQAGGGRGGKQFRGPLPEAGGRPHTRFRTDEKGVTHYETYGYPSSTTGKRVDVVGPPHEGVPTPHAVDTIKHVNPRDPSISRYTEGPVRPAAPSEIPTRRK